MRVMGALITLLMVIGCSVLQKQQDIDKKLTVVATFYPLYDLTRSIVGDKGTAYSIVPAGVEPHDYEPSPSDFEKLESADAFVTMGIEFEEFEQKLIDARNDVKVISASAGIPLLKIRAGTDIEIAGTELNEDVHQGIDSHIWLSPVNAQKMVLNIMEGLIKADPANGDYYLERGQTLINDLKLLDSEFKGGLASCKKEIILVNHNAFSYLARDYGFRTIEISGLEPEAEPTPRQLAELIDQAKKNNLKYVFYEELVDPRIAELIAREVGAQTLKLDPLEGTTDSSATYLSLMQGNLRNVEVALECR